MNRRTESEKGLNEKRQELSLARKLLIAQTDLNSLQQIDMLTEIDTCIAVHKLSHKKAS